MIGDFKEKTIHYGIPLRTEAKKRVRGADMTKMPIETIDERVACSVQCCDRIRPKANLLTLHSLIIRLLKNTNDER